MHKLSEDQINTFIDKSSTHLFKYCQKHDLHFTVTGISGGLDSAVTLFLAAKSSEKAQKDGYSLYHVGLSLPCHTDTKHVERAQACLDACNAHQIKISLSDIYNTIEESLLPDIESQVTRILQSTDQTMFSDVDRRISKGNIKARLRLLAGTYHVAKLLHGIVLSTGNYSEYMMGFWTLCGDVGDYSMLQNVFKGIELYDIARKLHIPQEILDAPPDDGLGIAEGGDEAQLGADYVTIDTILIQQLQKGSPLSGVSPELVQKVCQRSLDYAYKRKGCVELKREELGLPPMSEIDLSSAS